MIDLFPLFVANNVLNEVVPHVVDGADHDEDRGEAQDGHHREGDVAEVEVAVRGAAVDTAQRLDMAQLVQLAGQRHGGGQELRLGEGDEVAQSGPVLQQHRAEAQYQLSAVSSLQLPVSIAADLFYPRQSSEISIRSFPDF